MTPKSAADLADYYVDETLCGASIDEQVTHDAFLAGHAAGIAQAGELIAACEGYARLVNQQPQDAIVQALARFKALAGDV